MRMGTAGVAAAGAAGLVVALVLVRAAGQAEPAPELGPAVYVSAFERSTPAVPASTSAATRPTYTPEKGARSVPAPTPPAASAGDADDADDEGADDEGAEPDD